jgi:prolyl-tRNA synthetase
MIMRRSQLFIKTRKQAPADELAKNAQLLIRAGYIYKDAAGVYPLLPLGLRVVENIKSVVREEMNGLGGLELLMSTLQRKDLWQQTDRWDDDKVDVWFKSQLKNGTEIGLGWSHEEQITQMMKDFLESYRDLPAYVYQFQNKLRNELRVKSGVMRAREFIMKDMYSYSRTEEEHKEFYDKVSAAYLRIYEKLGLGSDTFLTFASGGAFTQFSHEFQTVTEAGEDTIYLSREKNIAINQEVLTDEVLQQLGLSRGELQEMKASEVGNIFSFGTTKSEQLGLYYSDEGGNAQPVVLGSYGIGITRLMGVMVEHFADERGLNWPQSVAPFKVYLARLGSEPDIIKSADEIYDKLRDMGVEVLYDDRDVRPGEMFADADLMGLPYRVVVSAKTQADNTYELKHRGHEETELLSGDKLLESLANTVRG